MPRVSSPSVRVSKILPSAGMRVDEWVGREDDRGSCLEQGADVFSCQGTRLYDEWQASIRYVEVSGDLWLRTVNCP